MKRFRLSRQSEPPAPVQENGKTSPEPPKERNSVAAIDESHLYPNITASGSSSNVMGNVHNHFYAGTISPQRGLSPQPSLSPPPSLSFRPSLSSNFEVAQVEASGAMEAIRQASKRDLSNDPHLQELAAHLCTSKPALKLSGAYLGEQEMFSVTYLDEHKDRIEDLEVQSPSLTRSQRRMALGQVSYDMTMEVLSNHHKNTAELFELFTCFDPRYISYAVVGAARRFSPLNLKTTLYTETTFEQHISVLKSYGLIEAHTGSYQIPDLIRPLTTQSLNENRISLLYKYATQCVSFAWDDYSKGEKTEGFQHLFHHAYHLLTEPFNVVRRRLFTDESYLVECNDVASVLFTGDRPDMVLDFLQEILPHKREILGPEDRSTLKTELLIGRAYHHNREYSQAVRALTRIVEILLQNKQEDDAIVGMIELADTFEYQKKYIDSERTFTQANDVLNSMPASQRKSNLRQRLSRYMGLFYNRDRKFEEAERYLTESLKLADERWGSQSLKSSYVARDVALFYHKQKRQAEFQQIGERAVEGYVRYFGRHFDLTLDLLDKLEASYVDGGQDEKLQALRQRYDLLPP